MNKYILNHSSYWCWWRLTELPWQKFIRHWDTSPWNPTIQQPAKRQSCCCCINTAETWPERKHTHTIRHSSGAQIHWALNRAHRQKLRKINIKVHIVRYTCVPNRYHCIKGFNVNTCILAAIIVRYCNEENNTGLRKSSKNNSCIMSVQNSLVSLWCRWSELKCKHREHQPSVFTSLQVLQP